MNIGEKIKKYRKDKGLSQAELAQACGLNRNSIYKYEKGETVPKYGQIIKLADALGIGISQLLDSISILDLTVDDMRERSNIKKAISFLTLDNYSVTECDNGLYKISYIDLPEFDFLVDKKDLSYISHSVSGYLSKLVHSLQDRKFDVSYKDANKTSKSKLLGR